MTPVATLADVQVLAAAVDLLLLQLLLSAVTRLLCHQHQLLTQVLTYKAIDVSFLPATFAKQLA